MLKAQGTKEDRRLKAVKAFLSKLHTGQRKEEVETNITNSEALFIVFCLYRWLLFYLLESYYHLGTVLHFKFTDVVHVSWIYYHFIFPQFTEKFREQ